MVATEQLCDPGGAGDERAVAVSDHRARRGRVAVPHHLDREAGRPLAVADCRHHGDLHHHGACPVVRLRPAEARRRIHPRGVDADRPARPARQPEPAPGTTSGLARRGGHAVGRRSVVRRGLHRRGQVDQRASPRGGRGRRVGQGRERRVACSAAVGCLRGAAGIVAGRGVPAGRQRVPHAAGVERGIRHGRAHVDRSA